MVMVLIIYWLLYNAELFNITNDFVGDNNIDGLIVILKILAKI